MFSQACIILSVHGEGGVRGEGRHVCHKGGGGMCGEGGMHGREGVHGRGHAWWWWGGCMAGAMCGRRHDHCSGWYASYWNAFLMSM